MTQCQARCHIKYEQQEDRHKTEKKIMAQIFVKQSGAKTVMSWGQCVRQNETSLHKELSNYNEESTYLTGFLLSYLCIVSFSVSNQAPPTSTLMHLHGLHEIPSIQICLGSYKSEIPSHSPYIFRLPLNTISLQEIEVFSNHKMRRKK